jgi:hypothetical protein
MSLDKINDDLVEQLPPSAIKHFFEKLLSLVVIIPFRKKLFQVHHHKVVTFFSNHLRRICMHICSMMMP